ncbi:MAG: PAS domain S-box protein [Candidatus Bathyarchaeia archaeon]|jgi:PAS domain S-box-containing protein
MDMYSGLSLLAGFICLALGFVVYSLNRRAESNKLFALASIAGFFYTLTTVLMWQAPNLESAYFWNKVGSIWPFFVVLVVHFALVFTQSSWLKNKFTLIALYLPAVFFWLVEVLTDWVNTVPVLKYWGYTDAPAATWIYAASTLWSAILPLLAFALCFRFYRKTSGETARKRRKFVTVGFGIPVVVFVITNMLFRSVGVDVPNLGHISIIFFGGLVGYAILKHDLFAFDAAFAAESILSTIPDSLILADIEGKMIRVNERLVNFLGYREEELIGESITKLCVDAHCLGTLKDLVEKRVINNCEVTCETKCGGEKQVLFSGSMVRSKTGRDIGIVCVLHNITERKKAEEDLANNRNYLETLLNSMLSGIIVIDASTHMIIDLNTTALKMIGATREEVLGRICHKFICPSERGKCPITDLGLPVDIQERVLLTANGDVTWILKNVTKLEANGRLLLIENFVDISERKQMQEKILRSERLASIGELAGQIGHDLRNPLTGIKSGAYFLKQKGDKITKADQKMILGIIENAVDDSNRIINCLIDYSSDLRLNITKSLLNSLLSRALLAVHIPPRIEIQNHVQDTIELSVDEPKIEQVFEHILCNSVEAIPEAGTIEVWGVQKGSNVEISFVDSGVGIPDCVLSKMFSPLNTTKAKGMGLSLAICKRIVEAHEGTIELKSTSGKGTTVIITLPLMPKPKNEFETNRCLLSCDISD